MPNGFSRNPRSSNRDVPHTLTTTVMRRTDGAPLAGWIVRYDVGGGAALGYEGGSATEATTDAAGRASVEVSPKDAGGGATNVCITIIRPQTAGPAAMPRLELGRGAATITWNAGAAPLPVLRRACPSHPAHPYRSRRRRPLSVRRHRFLRQQPNRLRRQRRRLAPTPAPNPYSPPAAAAAGKPKLEVNLRVAGSDQVAVGENASFDLTVTNRGDGSRPQHSHHESFRPRPAPSKATRQTSTRSNRQACATCSRTIRYPFGSISKSLTAASNATKRPSPPTAPTPFPKRRASPRARRYSK